MYICLKNKRFWRVCLFSLVGILSGCASQGMKLPQTLPEPDRSLAAPNLKAATQQSTKPKRIETVPSFAVLGANVSPKAAAQKLDLPKGKLTLNVDALALKYFIHLALGDVLKLTFEIDPEVAKRTDLVTLHIAKPTSAGKVLGMVEETLDLYDVAIVRMKHGLRVLPKAKLAQLPAILTINSVKVQRGQVAEVIPLRYTAMNELQFVVGSIFKLGKYGRVTFNKRLNAAIVIGDAPRVNRFKAFVNFLDRPSFEHKQLRLVRPIYWQSSKLVKQLIQILKAQGIPASDKVEDTGSLVVLDMKSINALLVVSPESGWMQQVETLIGRLDDVVAAGPGKRTFIYFTRHRGAGELGALISAALGSGSQHQSQSASSATSSAPAKPPASSKARSATVSGSKIGNLTVVADEKRNALIFIGTPSAYQQVVPILDRLDIPARQVLIEVTVADISLDNTNQLGVEWQFNNVDNSNALIGTLGTLGGLGVGSAGLTYALANNLGNVRAKINALATKGKAKILSSPTLLAMDGERAHMQVGTQISVVTQEVSNVQAGGATNTSLLRSFQYIDTGVILDITPTITDYGSIRMKLKQEVSEPGASATGQPPIFKRIIDTVMVAESGQTVLLGGLITHNKGVTRTQVPLLGDMPIIGALFRNDVSSDRSTELIILITPHVIRNKADASSLTEAYRSRLGW